MDGLNIYLALPHFLERLVRLCEKPRVMEYFAPNRNQDLEYVYTHVLCQTGHRMMIWDHQGLCVMDRWVVSRRLTLDLPPSGRVDCGYVLLDSVDPDVGI